MHVALARVDVDVRGALLDRLGDDRVHELDHRRVLVGLVHVQLGLGLRVLLLDDLFDRLLHAGEPHDQDVEVLDRGARRAHPATGEHRDVVDAEHVGRVGHRQQQGSVFEEANGHRLVAADRVHVDQVDRAHVELVDGQVDVLQAEALGHDTGELVVAQNALLDQDLAGRLALGARDLDRVLDLLTRREAQIDDHVADQPDRASVADLVGQRDRGAGACRDRRVGDPLGGSQQRQFAYLGAVIGMVPHAFVIGTRGETRT